MYERESKQRIDLLKQLRAQNEGNQLFFVVCSQQ